MAKLKLPLEKNHPLVKWANQIQEFYGYNVMLVGSQITGSESPRDVDIVCAIPDREFELRYGSVNDWVEQGKTGLWTEIRWKWANDCIKKSSDIIKSTGIQIDFKVQPMMVFNKYKHIHKQFPPHKLNINL